MVTTIEYLWDTRHYAALMLEPQCSAFFPLWPRLVQELFPATTMAEAARNLVYVSWGLTLASVPVLLALFRAATGNARVALGAVALFMLSPTALFRVIGYTEAIFALEAALALGLLMAVERGRAGPAVLAGLFVAAFAMALTRQVFAILVAAVVGALLVSTLLALWQGQRDAEAALRRRVAATVVLVAGAVTGFAVYGLHCHASGDGFLWSIRVQSEWDKRLQFNPVLLVGRTRLQELLALYYPPMLGVIALAVLARARQTGSSRVVLTGFVPFRTGTLLAIYPPSWFVLQAAVRWARTRAAEASGATGTAYVVPAMLTGLTFWFALFVPLAHALLIFFTTDNLMSLARFVFGQPFFYFALAILASGLARRWQVWGLVLFVAISAGDQVILWLRFAEGRWLG